MTVRITASAFKKHAAPKKRRIERELPIHLQILHWLQWQLPKAVIHHSPNELDMSGPNAARLVKKAKEMGMRPGWPDIEFLLNGRMYFLEVKAGKNSLSPDQKSAHDDIRAAGGFVATVYSLDEAKAAARDWGLLPTAA